MSVVKGLQTQWLGTITVSFMFMTLWLSFPPGWSESLNGWTSVPFFLLVLSLHKWSVDLYGTRISIAVTGRVGPKSGSSDPDQV